MPSSEPRCLFYNCFPGYTGSQKMTVQLARSFQDAGYEAIVSAPAELGMLQRARAAGVRTHVLSAPPSLLRFGGELLGGTALARARLVAFAVLPYNLRAALAAKRLRADVVYAAQLRSVIQVGLGARLVGLPVVWHAQVGLMKGSPRLHRAAARIASRIVCVSHAVAEDLEQRLGALARGKLEVVHNGLPDARLSGADSESGPDEGGRGVILFAGTVLPEKGVHHLVRALAAVPAELGARLRIAGDCPDPAYRSHLEALASEMGIADRIELLGYREDVEELMAASAVVACPSVEEERLTTPQGSWDVRWKEGFCLAALEGMRASRPVVASDSYGLREVVASERTGFLVPPGRPDAIAHALATLLRDPERAAAMGRAGRETFTERFRVSDQTRRFNEILTGLARRS